MLVNIHEAKTNFSKLVQRAANGEEIIIGRAGVPVARLAPLRPPAVDRTPGAWRGKVALADDFDDELPGDIGAAFRGLAE